MRPRGRSRRGCDRLGAWRVACDLRGLWCANGTTKHSTVNTSMLAVHYLRVARASSTTPVAASENSSALEPGGITGSTPRTGDADPSPGLVSSVPQLADGRTCTRDSDPQECYHLRPLITFLGFFPELTVVNISGAPKTVPGVWNREEGGGPTEPSPRATVWRRPPVVVPRLVNH
jgi:hypothetical protein